MAEEKEKDFEKEEISEKKEEVKEPVKKTIARKTSTIKKVTPKIKKKKYKVLGIRFGNILILEADNGTGLRRPIPEEYKNVKIGDIIEL